MDFLSLLPFEMLGTRDLERRIEMEKRFLQKLNAMKNVQFIMAVVYDD